jgi:uncharacterized membrane protein YhaH (DUF805 family)
MFEAYKRTLDFQGRAGRKEYWLYFLAYLIQIIVAMVIDNTLLSAFTTEGGVGILYVLVALANLVTALSVGFRRLHDTNRSAWWLLIALIPIIGGIVLLVFYVLPGTPGPNRFGPQPGAPELEETFA